MGWHICSCHLLHLCYVCISVTEAEMRERICSESVLLVRREDVLQRLTPDCSLSSLTENQSDLRWKNLDVEGILLLNSSHIFKLADIYVDSLFLASLLPPGQVRQMAVEQEHELTAHITIPAAYKSGITLFALRHSQLGQEIFDSPELPLM